MSNQLTVQEANKWLISFNKNPSKTSYKATLICFHWAGGNGQAFRSWSKYFENYNIDLRAMMLPGRMGRAKEPLISDIHEITGCSLLCCSLG